MSEYIPLIELADELGVNREYMRQIARRGIIKFLTFGRTIVVQREDEAFLREYFKQHRQNPRRDGKPALVAYRAAHTLDAELQEGVDPLLRRG